MTVGDYPSREGAECPFGVYGWWRSEAPVYRIPERPDVYVVSRYEDVRDVARNPQLFSSSGSRTGLNGFGFAGEQTGGRSMLETDPPGHRAKRELAFGPLKPGAIASYEPWITELVDGLIDRFEARGECDFVDDLARRLPVEVMIELYAIPREDRALLDRWGDLEVSGLSWMPLHEQERHMRNTEELGAYLARLVEERAADPGDDYIGHIIRAQVARDGELDSTEVLMQAANVLAGGAATTQHMLGGAMLLLLQHPDRLADAREDFSRIPRILEEAMRLESSVQWVPRVVTADTEVAGTPIPSGSYVLLMLASANRDPSRFDDPDAFDPERKNVRDHLAFGSGVHSCIGAPLARLEGRIALERFLTRLTAIELASDDLRHVPSPSFRGLQHLPLRFRSAA